MTTQITLTQINDLLKAHDIKGYANEWQGRRIYINLALRNDSRGNQNHQLYIDLATGELVNKLGKGLTTRAFDADVKAFVDAFNAAKETAKCAEAENKEETAENVEAENKEETNKIVVTRPVLKGTEKQIEWANQIIDLLIDKMGDASIPATATKEQIKFAQDMTNRFFAMPYSWEWIDRFKDKKIEHYNDVAGWVKIGWSGIDY